MAAFQGSFAEFQEATHMSFLRSLWDPVVFCVSHHNMSTSRATLQCPYHPPVRRQSVSPMLLDLGWSYDLFWAVESSITSNVKTYEWNRFCLWHLKDLLLGSSHHVRKTKSTIEESHVYKVTSGLTAVSVKAPRMCTKLVCMFQYKPLSDYKLIRHPGQSTWNRKISQLSLVWISDAQDPGQITWDCLINPFAKVRIFTTAISFLLR